MSISTRLRASSNIALLHLCISFVVILCVVCFVLLVWFPNGLHRLIGGLGLFLILMLVDLVCGPGLTLVLFDPQKSKLKWRIDIALIAIIQLMALGFGVVQIAKTRPVYIAFEGDRFRIVQALDIDIARIKEAPTNLQSLSWTGPRPVGVRLSLPSDPEYLESVQESIRGFHPSFRPWRWVDLETQTIQLLSSVNPLSTLETKSSTSKEALAQAVKEVGLPSGRLGYLPLVHGLSTDWIVLVDIEAARIVGWFPIDGW